MTRITTQTVMMMRSLEEIAPHPASDAVITSWASSRLKDSPAPQQSYDQNDQGDDDEGVDQAASDMEREEPQGPQYDQDDHNGF